MNIFKVLFESKLQSSIFGRYGSDIPKWTCKDCCIVRETKPQKLRLRLKLYQCFKKDDLSLIESIISSATPPLRSPFTALSENAPFFSTDPPDKYS